MVLLAVAALSVIWGLAWVAMKVALQDMGPFTFAALRFTAASAALAALVAPAWIRRRPQSDRPLYLRAVVRQVWPALVILGLMQTTAVYGLVNAAMLNLAAGKTSVLLYTMSLWSALLARWALGEPLLPVKKWALFFGMTGIGLIVGRDLLAPGSADAVRSVLIADGEVLLAAWCWAGANILYRKRLTPFPRNWVNAVQTWVGTAFLWPLVWGVEGGPRARWSVAAVGAVVFTGVFASALAFSLWYWLLERLDMATATLSVLSVPVLGLFFGALFLGERLPAPFLIGSAFILIGVGLAYASPAVSRPGSS
ncbi:DMT family transporter [Hydrogenibacillus schlegelii]|uniref:EamA domain-containing protein n=1 Tax=Hydrogenibacillus schlegelii TaxID=1484 RepID=A0A132MG47_HYDSH|nr:DMT family transporter [Hydrogenibacillus schlegelii]KWW96807.1 hypothetical protein TR75_11940 [Hydrogenibacillus schlegelii]OAR04760.1 hypothetical protein SA87_09670 [Hydrogenibacillus schlegelii]